MLAQCVELPVLSAYPLTEWAEIKCWVMEEVARLLPLFPVLCHLQIEMTVGALAWMDMVEQGQKPHLLWSWPPVSVQHSTGLHRSVEIGYNLYLNNRLYCYKPEGGFEMGLLHGDDLDENCIIYSATPASEPAHTFCGLNLVTHGVGRGT